MELRRRIRLVLVTTVIGAGSMLTAAPAWAGTGPAGATSVQVADATSRPCRPEHRGPRWRWHDTRRDDHWDHQVRRWDRHDRQWETQWVHIRWDDRYCARHGSGWNDRPAWSDHR